MKASSISENKILLSLAELVGSGWLGSADSAWLESQFKQYQADPSQVEPIWRQLFEKVSTDGSWKSIAHQMPAIPRYTQNGAVAEVVHVTPNTASAVSLVEAYRTYGHLKATVDPLGLTITPEIPELNLAAHGLDTVDLNTELALDGHFELEKATLANIIERLEALYCGTIGYEYQYISSQKERQWLNENIENYNAINTPQTKKRILHRLLESDGLEKHLASQFVGQKRFSIEGADSLMPMLDTLAIASAERGVHTLNVGMAHRGRLNVLINFLGKAPRDLFEEFSGRYNATDLLSGDVKYHKGFKSELNTMRGPLSAELAFNPSHLEIVNPVVEGATRAKQDDVQDAKEALQKVLPLLIHGDAAFAGQGVVMETLQLSQTPAYTTGGTIHVILNNQVGFTTDPKQARSARYCTDLAKMIEAPVLHVNGNDPEAACRAMDLALGFRTAFHKDVVIDLVCYRRHGHNEGDEPAATQPILYQSIRAQKPIWAYFAKQLQDEKIIEAGEAEAWLSDYRKRVATGDPVAVLLNSTVSHSMLNASDWRSTQKTSVAISTLKGLTQPLTDLPQGMQLQPQVGKLMADRKKMLEGELPLNWGTAETLAYATLLSEGFNIRLTGQDTERGTFAHRHAVLHDYKNGNTHTPLKTLTQKRQQFAIYDSILSEMATMGFEYGYAVAKENALVIWEAQYGDFVNGAQMVIDQFMSSGEQKWNQHSNLVLFLPHGYEGAGPEHSSARLERFLQLCAQDNIQVCAPTTPAQHFHLLRRQLLRENWRKPLIVMTPKSLLRHKQATSMLNELSEGQFKPVIDTQAPVAAEQIKRVILCSGKVYYDLVGLESDNRDRTAIIRIEQLYPFPDQELAKILNAYTNAVEVVWCQEEPKNQGAWQWISERLRTLLKPEQVLKYVGRKEAAATAVGSPLRHAAEQKELAVEALG